MLANDNDDYISIRISRRHINMKLVPLGDRVVLKQCEAEEKTKTVII